MSDEPFYSLTLMANLAGVGTVGLEGSFDHLQAQRGRLDCGIDDAEQVSDDRRVVSVQQRRRFRQLALGGSDMALHRLVTSADQE